MKLSLKTILPIILISALLILLTGCFGVTPGPGYTPGTGTITGIIAAPCCSTSAGAVSEPQGVSPEYWCYYCQETWSLQDGIEVVLTYGEDEVDTTTTNDKGEFTFTNVDPGKNYVITAYCPDFDDNRPLVKDVALELVEGGSFDTKITDLVSTSLGLVVDFLVTYTELTPEDIVLDDVIANKPNFYGFPRFKKLIIEVQKVLEVCGNVDADEDVQDALCEAAEEVGRIVIPDLELGCGPGYTPGPGPTPTPDPCDPNTAPDITLVEYDDGSGFVAVEPNDEIHVIVGQSYIIRVTATDDTIKDPLTYSGTVDGVPFGPNSSNQITVAPIEINLNGYSVSLSVYDGCDPTPWGPVTVFVHDECYENQGPWVIIADKSINAGDSLSYVIDFVDYDAGDDGVTGDPSYALSNEPTGMSIDTATGTITFATACGEGNIYEAIEVTITDACGEVASDTFTLTVVECDLCDYANQGPWVIIADKSINAGDSLSYVIDFVDYDAGDDGVTGDPSYALSNEPTGMSIDTATGTITFATACGEGNIYEAIEVTITDACGEVASDTFTLTVVECDLCDYANQGPWVIIADKSINAGDSLSYVIDFVDYDAGDDGVTGDPSYALSNEPTGMSIDTATGTITFATACGEGNIYEAIEVTITDACGEVASDTFTLTVVECDLCDYANQGPWVIIADKSINAGDSLSYVIDFVDYDAGDDGVTGDPSYALSNEPTGMSIDTATGTITFATACGEGNIYEAIEVTITDACGEVASDTFTLTVVECDLCDYANQGPWVIIADKSINAGDSLSYVIDFVDYDAGDDGVTGDPSYALSNEPTGMIIDTATGTITFATACGEGNIYEAIEVTITDACGETAYDTFTLTVNEFDPCIGWSANVAVAKWYAGSSGHSDPRLETSGTIIPPDSDCIPKPISVNFQLRILNTGGNEKESVTQTVVLPLDNSFDLEFDLDNASYNAAEKYELSIQYAGCSNWILIDSGPIIEE